MSNSNRLTANHPRFHEIPCPMQKAGIKAGVLIADLEGNVTKANGDQFLHAVGARGIAKKFLLSGGAKAAPNDNKDGGWNVFKLRGSNLDHDGDTGILDPSQPKGYNEARLEGLLSLSRNGKTIKLAELSAKHSIRTDEDSSGGRAKVLGLAELGAMLAALGQDGEMTLDEVRNFYANSEFPPHFKPNEKTNRLDALTMVWTVIKMAVHKVWQRMTGSLDASKKGYEAALDKPRTHAADQALKGAEGGCPFGFDKMFGGGQPPEANKPSDEARS